MRSGGLVFFSKVAFVACATVLLTASDHSMAAGQRPPLSALDTKISQLRRAHPELAGLSASFERIAGTLEATLAEDFVAKQFTRSNVLVTADGARLQLHFTAADPELQSGQALRVYGVRLGDHVVLDGAPLLGAGSSGQTGFSAPRLEAPALVGVRKMAVVLYHYESQAPPWSVAFARGAAFTDAFSIRNFYREASYGALTLEGSLTPATGDVFGWYTLPGAAPLCGEYGSSAAAALAAADGFFDGNYQHVIYAFAGTSCGYIGKAEPGGRRVWFNDGAFNVGAVAHEVGHNLGLGHSPSLRCSASGAPVPFSTTCIANEYGDPFDLMGDAWEHRHFKPENKQRQGWLTELQVTADGTFTLAPHALASTGTRALMVGEIGTAPFHVELRAPTGVFDNFGASDPAVRGVLIRAGGILDMTPGTPSFLDAALAVGQTFTDPATGLTIRTQSVDSTGATVAIAFGPCVRKTPSMTVSSNFETTPAGGNALTYRVGVTNQDFTTCGPSTFSLTPTLPGPGWVQQPMNPSAVIAPGESTSWDLAVTAPVGIAEATYTIEQTALNTASSLSYATSLLYEVKTPDTTPPAMVSITAPLDGAVYRQEQLVTLNVAVSADVTRVDFFDGPMRIGSSFFAPFQKLWPVGTFNNGPHVFTAQGFDAAGNSLVSAPVRVTVSIGTDLAVTALATTSPRVMAGETLSTELRVANDGLTPAGASAVGWVLSTDAVFGGADDVPFATQSLVAPLGAEIATTLNTVLTVPSGTPAGHYFVCASADVLNAVDESDETNNARCSASALRVVSRPPSLLSAASATPSPVSGTQVTLDVRATDDAGEAHLTYHWETTSGPAPVRFSLNGDNAAKTVVATFDAAGDYVFRVTVTDADGNSLSSDVEVTVTAQPTSLSLTPPTVTLRPRQTQQFSASVTDQFQNPLAAQPSVTFTAQGGGVVDSNGFFTAGSTVGGPYGLSAAAGGLSATAQVTVISADDVPPRVALVRPEGGARLSGLTTLAAEATDDVGVATVQFALDGVVLGEVSALPYELTVDTVLWPVGPHALTALAHDTSGNAATAEPVLVVVERGGPVSEPDGAEPVTGACACEGGQSAGPTAIVWAFMLGGLIARKRVRSLRRSSPR